MSTQHFLNKDLNQAHARSFYPAYQNCFRVVEAQSDTLREIAFRLRYQVYCLENSMDPGDTAALAEVLEKDSYDDHALHYLLYSKREQEAVGTIRVILPQEDKPLHSFPLQGICDHPLIHAEDKVQKFCEISHFCMIESFRKRPGDGRILPAYFDPDQEKDQPTPQNMRIRRIIPFAPLGLLRAAFEGALDRNISDCLCLLSPDELHTLQHIGLSISELGGRVDLCGPQQPLIFNIKHTFDNMILKNPPCWEILSDRGRLHIKANALEQNIWYDKTFDQNAKDALFSSLST